MRSFDGLLVPGTLHRSAGIKEYGATRVSWGKRCRCVLVVSLVVLAACDPAQSDEEQSTGAKATSTTSGATTSTSQPNESVDITISGQRDSLRRTVVVEMGDYIQSVSNGTTSLPLVVVRLSFPEGATTFQGRLTAVPLALPGCDLVGSTSLEVTVPLIVGGAPTWAFDLSEQPDDQLCSPIVIVLQEDGTLVRR